MANHSFHLQGDDEHFVHFGHFYYVDSLRLKNKYLFLSQTVPNLEGTDRLGALVMTPEQVNFLIGVMEFALPHGVDESQKRELQTCYRLLLDLRDGLENTKVEPPA